MIRLPKYVQKRVSPGDRFSPNLAVREAESLDYKARLAHLDDRLKQAKKYSRYADELRRMARSAA